MAITYIGSATGTTSVTVPTHQAGDILIAFATRDGSATLPTLAAGWTSITTQTTNTFATRLAVRVASAPGTTATGFTSATALVVVVYRVSSGSIFGINAVAMGGASTSTAGVIYPALTMATTDRSWVIRFAGHKDTTTNLQNPPTGYTNRANAVLTTVQEISAHDSNGIVATNPTADTVTVGGVSTAWVSASVELTEVLPPHGWDTTYDSYTYSAFEGITNGLATNGGFAGFTSGVDAIPTGSKIYFEQKYVATGSNIEPGICDFNGSFGALYNINTGGVRAIVGTTYGTSSTLSVGDTLGIAVDTTNNNVWFRKNGGTWYGNNGAGDPATNTNGVPIQASTVYYACLKVNNGGTSQIGLRSGTPLYTAPTGYTYLDGTSPPVTIAGTAAITEAGDTVTSLAGAPAVTIWDHSTKTYSGASNDDGQSLTRGLQTWFFNPGTVTHVSFWKMSDDVLTTRVVGIYNAAGTLVASATSANEPTGTSQWIEVPLSTPFHVTGAGATATYTIAVHGRKYPASSHGLDSGIFSSDGSVYALSNGEGTPGNGVYDYGASIVKPASTFQAGDYWVDLKFLKDGIVPIGGTAAITEAADSVGTAATVALKATLGVTQANDTVSSATKVAIAATVSVTQANDTVSSNSKVAVVATLSASEVDDALSSTGTLQPVSFGTLAATEAADAVASNAKLAIAATFAITEAGDAGASGSVITIVGTASLTEAGDTVEAVSALVPEVPESNITCIDHGVVASGDSIIFAAPLQGNDFVYVSAYSFTYDSDAPPRPVNGTHFEEWYAQRAGGTYGVTVGKAYALGGETEMPAWLDTDILIYQVYRSTLPHIRIEANQEGYLAYNEEGPTTTATYYNGGYASANADQTFIILTDAALADLSASPTSLAPNVLDTGTLSGWKYAVYEGTPGIESGDDFTQSLGATPGNYITLAFKHDCIINVNEPNEFSTLNGEVYPTSLDGVNAPYIYSATMPGIPYAVTIEEYIYSDIGPAFPGRVVAIVVKTASDGDDTPVSDGEFSTAFLNNNIVFHKTVIDAAQGVAILTATLEENVPWEPDTASAPQSSLALYCSTPGAAAFWSVLSIHVLKGYHPVPISSGLLFADSSHTSLTFDIPAHGVAIGGQRYTNVSASEVDPRDKTGFSGDFAYLRRFPSYFVDGADIYAANFTALYKQADDTDLADQEVVDTDYLGVYWGAVFAPAKKKPTDGFSSSDITLEGWYRSVDPDGLVAPGADFYNGTAITDWIDRSGAGRTLIKEGTLTYNATGLGTGRPTVDSANSGAFRTASGMAYPSGVVSAFAVLSFGADSGKRIVSIITPGGHDAFGTSTGCAPIMNFGPNTFEYFYDFNRSPLPYTPDAPSLFEGYAIDSTHAVSAYNGTAGSSATIGINSPSLDRLGFGTAGHGEGYLTGKFSELVLVFGVMSPEDVAFIEGYLAWNNGIQASLPSGHTYASAPPMLIPPEESETVTGTVALTEAGDSVAATTLVTTRSTVTVTEAGDSAASVAALSIKATASLNETDDVSSNASITIRATASITEANDTAAASSTTAIAGSAALTEADDTVSGTSGLAVKATLSATETDDTVAAIGSLQPVTVGTAALVEDNDTTTSAATTSIKASAAIVEAGDTALSSAGAILASAAITEAGDVATFTSTLSLAGTVAANDNNDVVTSTAVTPIVSTVALNEAGDTVTSVTTVAVAATLSATENDDSVSGTSKLSVSGSVTVAETGDTLLGAAAILIVAASALQEAGDTVSAAGNSFNNANTNLTDADDGFVSTAVIKIAANSNVIEDGDTGTSSASNPLASTVDMVEQGDTVDATSIIYTITYATVDIIEEGDKVWQKLVLPTPAVRVRHVAPENRTVITAEEPSRGVKTVSEFRIVVTVSEDRLVIVPQEKSRIVITERTTSNVKVAI